MSAVQLRPLLLGLALSATEARFTVQHGGPLDLVAPLPVMVGGLVEVGPEVLVDILTPERQPLYGFAIDRSTPEGGDLLVRLCSELLGETAPD